jgi:16S rRNA (cytosine1402-N4)-methyltransferase
MSAHKQVHVPVLLHEALAALDIRQDGVYLDGTFGRGGHTAAILQQLGPEGRLFGMDKDPAAARVAEELAAQDSRFVFRKGSFAQMDELIGMLPEFKGLDGVLLDLGVSSPQLDTPERGFSFSSDGPLDMRMDTTTGVSVAQWLGTASEAEIADVLWRFGEERFSRRIARRIVEARQEGPVNTTAELAALIRAAMPTREMKKDPATRSFQALRIFINRELEDLELGLKKSVEMLRPGGRLVVISFHSLEDRIVKRFMRRLSQPARLPRRLPVKDSSVPMPLKLIGKAVKASGAEVAANPRARSAIMRVAEKQA